MAIDAQGEPSNASSLQKARASTASSLVFLTQMVRPPRVSASRLHASCAYICLMSQGDT